MWKSLRKTLRFDGSPWLKVYFEEVLLEDGETVVNDFYTVEEPSYVMIFALTVDGQIPLIQQYKHGVGRRILELPAGYIEAGEDPLDAARRELLEETGYSGAEWESLGVYVKDGNRGLGQCHTYMVQQAEPTALPNARDLQVQTLIMMKPDELRALVHDAGFATLDTTTLVLLGLERLRADH